MRYGPSSACDTVAILHCSNTVAWRRLPQQSAPSLPAESCREETLNTVTSISHLHVCMYTILTLFIFVGSPSDHCFNLAVYMCMSPMYMYVMYALELLSAHDITAPVYTNKTSHASYVWHDHHMLCFWTMLTIHASHNYCIPFLFVCLRFVMFVVLSSISLYVLSLLYFFFLFVSCSCT